jgi:hypothetical protein
MDVHVLWQKEFSMFWQWTLHYYGLQKSNNIVDFLNFQCGYISNKLRRIYDFSIRSVKSVNLGHISLADLQDAFTVLFIQIFYPHTSSANFQAGVRGMAA